MKRIMWVLAAAGLAFALLVVGMLAPFRPKTSSGTQQLPRGGVMAPAAPATGTGNLDDTISSLQRRLRSSDADWKAFATLGLAYLQKARLTADPSYYPKAKGVLARSLRLHPANNFEASIGLGVLAAARHDFDAALRWSKNAVRIRPVNADARALEGDALVELGRYPEAGDAFQEMIDLRPDLSAYARVSYYRELHGDTHGALEAMKLAVDAAGGAEDGAWAAYQLGELYYSRGRLGAAEAAYEQGAFSAPDYELPKVGLAKVAAARGHLGRAVELLNDVVRTLPSPEFVTLLGDMHLAAGDGASSRRQYALVRAIYDLSNDNGVNTDAEMALFDADHHHNLRTALHRARLDYRQRKSVQVADALAWVLYVNKRYEQAERYSAEALRLGTKSALFEFHAGMIAMKLDKLDSARSHLSRALELNPHFSFLHRGDALRALRELRTGG